MPSLRAIFPQAACLPSRAPGKAARGGRASRWSSSEKNLSSGLGATAAGGENEAHGGDGPAKKASRSGTKRSEKATLLGEGAAAACGDDGAGHSSGENAVCGGGGPTAGSEPAGSACAAAKWHGASLAEAKAALSKKEVSTLANEMSWSAGAEPMSKEAKSAEASSENAVQIGRAHV